MRAIRIHETGGPDVLRLEEVERPRAGPRDVVVMVRAASLNHLDIWVRTGSPRPPLPHTLGSDAAGVIAEVGAEAGPELAARGLKVGDAVIVDPGVSCGACFMCRAGEQSQCPSFHLIGERTSGTLAELAVVPARNCHPKPAGLSWPEAGAFGLVFLTAWRMLVTRAQLRAGESVLVHGIGGGVATAALLVARAAGAVVTVTSSSDDKIARALALGAARGVNYRTAGKDLLGALRGPDGSEAFDVVVDTTGAATWSTSLRAMRKGGRLVTCGATTGGGPPADLHRIFWNQLSILGSTMGTPRELTEVLRLAERGVLRPVVDEVYPLERTVDAMSKLESGGQFGKVVIEVSRG